MARKRRGYRRTRVGAIVAGENEAGENGNLCLTTRQHLFVAPDALPHQEEVVEFLLFMPSLFDPIEIELAKPQIFKNLAVLPGLGEDLSLRPTLLIEFRQEFPQRHAKRRHVGAPHRFMLQLRANQTTAKLLLEMAAQFEVTLCHFRQPRSRFRLFRKDGLEFQTLQAFLTSLQPQNRFE